MQVEDAKPSKYQLEEKSRIVAHLAQAKVEKKFEQDMWEQ